MIDALQIAASGLRSQQEQIDAISNNVANMQTPGFKRSRVSFVDVAAPNGVAPAGDARDVSGGAGTEATPARPVFTDGDVRLTRDPLHVAIRGNGLLEVDDGHGGRAYTRIGMLAADAEGFLAVMGGRRLSVGIQLPPDAHAVSIDATGVVRAQLGAETEATELGRLELVGFRDPSALRVLGDGLYGATEAAGDMVVGRPGEEGLGGLLPGYVEVSNVELIDEMTALVLAQRAYQLNARVLQASDQILETINNLRR